MFNEVSSFIKVAVNSVGKWFKPNSAQVPKQTEISNIVERSLFNLGSYDDKYCEKFAICHDLFQKIAETKNWVLYKLLLTKIPKHEDHTHFEGCFHPDDIKDMCIEEDLYVDPITFSNLVIDINEQFMFYKEPVAGKELIKAKDLGSDAWAKLNASISITKGERKKFVDSEIRDKFLVKAFIIRGKILDLISEEKKIERFLRIQKESNVIYTELMSELDKSLVPTEFIERHTASWTSEKFAKADFAELEELEKELKNSGFIDKYYLGSMDLLNKSSPPAGSGIQFTRILELLRTDKSGLEIDKEFLLKFFAHTAAYMRLAHTDSRVSGINLVGPQYKEDAKVNLPAQMRILEYFGCKYYNAGIAVHVGEVNTEMMSKAKINSELEIVLQTLERINESRKEKDTKTTRLGHFTSIQYSDKLVEIICRLKELKVVIELSLTSITSSISSKAKTPAVILVETGLPILLNTDDGGITGKTLEDEYKKFTKLVIKHTTSESNPNLQRVRNCFYTFFNDMNKLGLRGSFLEGESLYDEKQLFDEFHRTRTIYEIKEPFKNILSQNFTLSEEAARFLATSKKANEEYRLIMATKKAQEELVDLTVDFIRQGLLSPEQFIKYKTIQEKLNEKKSSNRLNK
ncbi:MAG: hypothetical protein BGO10_10920 [Chlamydia sp. 32-24]|nr:MAG: hypothetical protein BGO10_10920 [Chlamydia sp. 32-24]